MWLYIYIGRRIIHWPQYRLRLLLLLDGVCCIVSCCVGAFGREPVAGGTSRAGRAGAVQVRAVVCYTPPQAHARCTTAGPGGHGRRSRGALEQRQEYHNTGGRRIMLPMALN